MHHMVSRFLIAGMMAIMSLGGVVHASGEAHGALPPKAPVVFSIPLPGGIEIPFSNSLVLLVITIAVLTLIVRFGARRMTLIPGGAQNFLEMVYEKLYGFIEGMLGPRLTKRYFWYFGSVFIVILASNYMGLLPGVGIITYGGEPLLRGPNADMNTTVFLGFSFAILWFYWSIRESGFKHFVLHIFGPKGNFKGFMLTVLMPVFLFVGLIECLSIIIRPIALAARLFGNIYAGENIIETMAVSAPFYISWLFVLPFYAMELLVGFIQALVFLLLTVVFLKLQVGDEDHAPASGEASLSTEQDNRKTPQREAPDIA